MKMACRILGVFLLVTAVAAATVRAEDAPAASAPPFTITGFVDTYYSYNFNSPDSRLNNLPTTNFDFYNNAFSLSLAEVVISKAAEPVGFRIDLDYGPTTEWVHGNLDIGTHPAAHPSGANEFEFYKNIQQAYVSWATPLKINLDFGKFVTHMGAEVIESKDNWNYTRGLLFCCAIPYYHSGIRANYPINDMLFVNGYALNGWNDVIENNNSKTFGATIGITPMPMLPILLSWIGPEEAIGDRQVYEAIVTLNLTDSITFMVDYNAGNQKDAADKTLKYSGLAAYARWKKDPCAVAVRYEMTDDKDNLMFGGANDANSNGNKISEITVTAEHTVAKNLLTRLEYRMDMSDDKIYENKDSATNPLTDPKDSQSRIVISAVYMF